MDTTVQITSIKRNEIESLRTLSIETFRDTYAAANKPENIDAYIARCFSTTRIEQELSDPNSQFFFAKCNGEIAGYLKVNTNTAQTEQELTDAMEVERIYARKSHHGKGVGKALMQQAKTLAHQAGVRWLWLGVWEENPHAIEFYKRQGFDVFGTHVFLMGDDPQRDFMMRLALT
jgi:ribosomal protein S18 acetylase RimI-like enzyme